jgi:hypothetical protein
MQAGRPTGMRRTGIKLLWRELAIPVFVERLQRLAGFGDFVGINHPIMVGVQRSNDQRWRTMTARAGTIERWHVLLGNQRPCHAQQSQQQK